MEPCARPPTPVTPTEGPRISDFLPFEQEGPRTDDTAEFLERCSLDYSQPSKISVVSRQPHTGGTAGGVSECSDECELDGSYTEYVETQWVKGSGSEGGDQDTPCQHDSVADVRDIGSDTESVVISTAPLHGPTTVKCVCVCKKRNCKFVNKPFDVLSIRESPVSKVSMRYRMVTWLTALRPQRSLESPTLDQVDGAKVHPEKKSKMIQMFRSRKGRRKGSLGEGEVPNSVATILNGVKKSTFPSRVRRRLKNFPLSLPRCFGVAFGLVLVMLGVTYDHGVKHGVDDILQDCWSWLRTSYMNFGDEFVSYNTIFFRMTNSKLLYGDPYPKYGPNVTKNAKGVPNITRFSDAINNIDPKFLFVLEGLRLSVQLHFFSIDEKSHINNPKVMVHDQGPLFFRISFRRTEGLYVDYIPERSNMTLNTPFQIYDLMKMIVLSNGLPYFGMHMHDYLKTTPSALFSMIIDNLQKFKVDTTFLASIQAQIQKGRRRSRYMRGKKRRRKRRWTEEDSPDASVSVRSTTERITKQATIETVKPSSSNNILLTDRPKVSEGAVTRTIANSSISSSASSNLFHSSVLFSRLSTSDPAVVTRTLNVSDLVAANTYISKPSSKQNSSVPVTSIIRQSASVSVNSGTALPDMSIVHNHVTVPHNLSTSESVLPVSKLITSAPVKSNTLSLSTPFSSSVPLHSIESPTNYSVLNPVKPPVRSRKLDSRTLPSRSRDSMETLTEPSALASIPSVEETRTVAPEEPLARSGIITSDMLPARVSTFAPVLPNSARTITEQLTFHYNSSISSQAPISVIFERIRRSTEEPTKIKSAWKSLAEMSRKIFLPLPLDTKKTVLLPVPFLEKNLTLKYRHSVKVLGLPGYQFVLGNDITKESQSLHHDLYPSLSYSRVQNGETRVDGPASSNSHSQRHRYNNEKRKHLHHRHFKHQNSLESDSYRKNFNDVLGVVDLEPLLVESIGKRPLMGKVFEHYPFWLSPPHFLSLTDHIANVDKAKIAQETRNTSGSRLSLFPSKSQKNFTNKTLLVGVEGVTANESLHGSFIYYHPILGVPINASLAIQVGIRPPEGMLHAHKLVPIMWTRVQVEEIPLTLWYILWAACHLRETIMACLIISGGLIITCALTCRREKRQRPEERPGSA